MSAALDDRMRCWAVAELAAWGVDPTPENVDRLLDTAVATRQRAHYTARDLGRLLWAPFRRLDRAWRSGEARHYDDDFDPAWRAE